MFSNSLTPDVTSILLTSNNFALCNESYSKTCTADCQLDTTSLIQRCLSLSLKMNGADDPLTNIHQRAHETVAFCPILKGKGQLFKLMDDVVILMFLIVMLSRLRSKWPEPNLYMGKLYKTSLEFWKQYTFFINFQPLYAIPWTLILLQSLIIHDIFR